MGRFINADSYASTGQGVLGYNMYAYCGNNPVNTKDESGKAAVPTDIVHAGIGLAALLDSFTPFVEVALAVGTIAAVGALAIKASTKEDDKVLADTKTVAKNQNDTIIYRYYATKKENLAPRPGVDFDGLSFSTKPPRPGIKAVQTTVGAVNATGILHAAIDSKSHVTITPAPGTGNVEMWMAMGHVSPWTFALSMIVIEMEG